MNTKVEFAEGVKASGFVGIGYDYLDDSWLAGWLGS